MNASGWLLLLCSFVCRIFVGNVYVDDIMGKFIIVNLATVIKAQNLRTY